MKVNDLSHKKLCFVCLLYMGVLQRVPIPKLCFPMVLTICKDFCLQIVRIFCHDLTHRSCPRLTSLYCLSIDMVNICPETLGFIKLSPILMVAKQNNSGLVKIVSLIL